LKSGISLAPNLVSSLLSWYDANRRNLPWRKTTDPYPVLLSEIMLQQTTVQAVAPYFEKWMKKYPTVGELAAADPSQVLRDWEGLGYYSRARNLHAAAREVVRRYGGVIPREKRELKGLPGVGEYTAAAVASIAFGARIPALDANSLRVWSRLLASSDRKRIARVFGRALPPRRPGDFNQALMDLGSGVCTPVKPRCGECPLPRWCRARGSGWIEMFPEKKPRTETSRVEAAIGILLEGNKVLVQKRPETGLMAGLWEFPGGKVEKPVREHGSKGLREKKGNGPKKGPAPHAHHPPTRLPEGSEQAVLREVREETGLDVQVTEKLGVFEHSYTRFRVRLHVFICKMTGGKLQRPEARWVTMEELENLPMPSANRRIVKKFEEWLAAEEN